MTQILTQFKSESRTNLLSRPIKNLDNIKTKKSRHHQPLSSQQPYLQHSTKKLPRVCQQNHVPRGSKQQIQENNISMLKKIRHISSKENKYHFLATLHHIFQA